MVWKFGDNVEMVNIGWLFLVCVEWKFGIDQLWKYNLSCWTLQKYGGAYMRFIN